MEDLWREGSSYGFLYADGSVAAGACLDAFEGVVGLYEVHVLGDEGCLLLDGGGGYNDLLLFAADLQLAAFHL